MIKLILLQRYEKSLIYASIFQEQNFVRHSIFCTFAFVKMKTMTEKLKFIPVILVVAALGVVAWSLLNYEENLLWKLQEW